MCEVKYEFKHEVKAEFNSRSLAAIPGLLSPSLSEKLILQERAF